MQDRSDDAAALPRAATSRPARASPRPGRCSSPRRSPASGAWPRRSSRPPSPSRCSSSAATSSSLRVGLARRRARRRARHPLLREPSRAGASSPTSRAGSSPATPPPGLGEPRRRQPTASATGSTREARPNGVAAGETSDGRQRLVVTRTGPRPAALARSSRVPPSAPRRRLRAAHGVPWLRLDAAGRILDANAAAAALADGRPTLDASARRRRRCAPTACTSSPANGEAVRAVVSPAATAAATSC